MDKKKLLEEIEKLNIPKHWYSINDGIKIDAYIVDEVHGKFRYYYYDEKGNYQNLQEFNSESDAYEYILEKLKVEKQYPSIKWNG